MRPETGACGAPAGGRTDPRISLSGIARIMTPNTSEDMFAPTDTRLNTLSEIAHACFGVETFPSYTDQADARHVACAESSIARALEGAYDIGLIAG
jgi:hypothetical protein